MQPTPSQVAQTTSRPTTPSVVATQVPQTHYYQHSYKFMGIPQKETVVHGHEMQPQQHQQQNTQQTLLNPPAPMMQNPQAMSGLYSQGIPMHTQVIPSQGLPPQGMPPTHGSRIPAHGHVIPQHAQMMPSQDQMPMNAHAIDQPPYAAYVGQQQQQQHLHGYAPSPLPPSAPQWQSQQPGMGSGWMK